MNRFVRGLTQLGLRSFGSVSAPTSFNLPRLTTIRPFNISPEFYNQVQTTAPQDDRHALLEWWTNLEELPREQVGDVWWSEGDAATATAARTVAPAGAAPAGVGGALLGIWHKLSGYGEHGQGDGPNVSPETSMLWTGLVAGTLATILLASLRRNMKKTKETEEEVEDESALYVVLVLAFYAFGFASGLYWKSNS